MIRGIFLFVADDAFGTLLSKRMRQTNPKKILT